MEREDQAGLGRVGREEKSMFQNLWETQISLSHSPKEFTKILFSGHKNVAYGKQIMKLTQMY